MTSVWGLENHTCHLSLQQRLSFIVSKYSVEKEVTQKTSFNWHGPQLKFVVLSAERCIAGRLSLLGLSEQVANEHRM